MITPATSPVTTEQDSPIQLSIWRRYKIIKVAIAISTELRFVPNANECRRLRIVAPSLVRTKNIPIIDRNMPTAAITIGAMTAFNCISGEKANAVAPRAAVERILPQ